MAETEKRKRGRPPATEAERAVTIERILAATEQAFGQYGYHGVNLNRILERAGSSRSLFYQYFRNIEEPINTVIRRYAEGLVDALATPLRDPAGDVEQRMLGGIEAYITYTWQRRHIMTGYTVSLHDTSTPVDRIRSETWRRISDLILEMFSELDRSPPAPLELDTFLTVAEFVCFRLATEDDPPDDAVAQARRVLIRCAISILGDRQSWQRALEVHGLLPDAAPIS